MRRKQEPRIYNLYIYNNLEDIRQVNYSYEVWAEIKQDLKELRKPGTWLYNFFSNKFKFYIISDTTADGTIREKIAKANHPGCMEKGIILNRKAENMKSIYFENYDKDYIGEEIPRLYEACYSFIQLIQNGDFEWDTAKTNRILFDIQALINRIDI